MMRAGHASTMTLGIYDTPSSSSLSLSRPSYNCDTRPNTPSQYLTIYLTNDDPTDALFITDSGQTLYQSRTAPLRVSSPGPLSQNIFNEGPLSPSSTSTSTSSHTYTPMATRVSRLYGSRAHAIREAAIKRGDRESADEGLLVAELEWLSRICSSRIRFGDGLAVNKQNAVDVRVDEFLKSTNGRGFSKMFATPNGRTYKWKTDTTYSQPAYLVECDGDKRVSGPLVTFECVTGESDSMNGRVEGGNVPFLRVATRLLPVIDQVLVSWVIMERERRSMATPSSPPWSGFFPSFVSPTSSPLSSLSSGLSSPSV